MFEFFLSFIFILILVAGMAIGVIRGREPISGTCGGLNKVGIDGACEICGGDTNKCEEVNNAGFEASGLAEINPKFHKAS